MISEEVRTDNPNVDSTQSDVLGDTYNRRVWTRSGSHSHQFPGKACHATDDAHARPLWRAGLGSTPDRSPKGAFQLVRIRPDRSCYRGFLGGGRVEVFLVRQVWVRTQVIKRLGRPKTLRRLEIKGVHFLRADVPQQ